MQTSVNINAMENLQIWSEPGDVRNGKWGGGMNCFLNSLSFFRLSRFLPAVFFLTALALLFSVGYNFL